MIVDEFNVAGISFIATHSQWGRKFLVEYTNEKYAKVQVKFGGKMNCTLIGLRSVDFRSSYLIGLRSVDFISSYNVLGRVLFMGN